MAPFPWCRQLSELADGEEHCLQQPDRQAEVKGELSLKSLAALPAG